MCDECKAEMWIRVVKDDKGKSRYLCGDCYARFKLNMPKIGDMSQPRPPVTGWWPKD